MWMCYIRIWVLVLLFPNYVTCLCLCMYNYSIHGYIHYLLCYTVLSIAIAIDLCVLFTVFLSFSYHTLLHVVVL